MRAARLIEPGRMEIVEVPKPVAGAGDLLVRVEACGICGSDRHMFRGEYPTAWPVTLGHEFAGIVEEAGPGVTGFSPGDRITGDPNIACGQCRFCREGRPNLCETLSAIGVQRDGGFAEYVLVPAGQAANCRRHSTHCTALSPNRSPAASTPSTSPVSRRAARC